MRLRRLVLSQWSACGGRPSLSGGGLDRGLECPGGLLAPEVSLAPGVWPAVDSWLDLQNTKKKRVGRAEGPAH